MPANEWASVIPVGDHPDYPSGSTTLCAAEAQAARRFQPVWAGVHFRTAVERSVEFGTQFGGLAHEHVQRNIKGEVKD